MKLADRTGSVFSAEVRHQGKSLGIIVLDTDWRTCREPELYVQTQKDGEWLYARLTDGSGQVTYKKTRFYLGQVGW